ncbi:pyrroline-5-carboxylate reductase 3-like isoform X2 [Scyliorhinus torazame]|uniref:pyrroline-5-carboxylate reductase 3-like isoform X2 n=1 Tax=Scyliorhinus torazame TaxID=75743 RepID=UPI003B5BBC79
MEGEGGVGFIGGGKMAFGIAVGILESGNVKPEKIMASAPSNNNVYKFKEAGMKTTHCNSSVLENCKVVFLSVKPHILTQVLSDISPFVTPTHLIVSVAAGVTVETLEKFLPAGTKVLRMMPNLPCTVQQGSMVFCRGSNAGTQEAAFLKSLLAACGLCEETPESYMDIHTGISGSGVAYGAAKMMLETGEHPGKLKNDVCTPGGTTIHGLYELEKGNLRCTVMNAVEAATKRARELGKD